MNVTKGGHASTPPKQSPSLHAQTNIQARKLMIARIHPDRQPRTHTHRHKDTHTCAISDRSLQLSVQNDTFIRTHNTCIHTYICTYIHTYIHTCMHTYTHIYIHTLLKRRYEIHTKIGMIQEFSPCIPLFGMNNITMGMYYIPSHKYSGVARPSLMVGHIFLSMISYWQDGSYVHLLKIVVCMKNALAINSSKTNVKA